MLLIKRVYSLHYKDMRCFRVFLRTPIHETMCRYSLNPEEAFKIEPNPAQYLGALSKTGLPAVSLPAGQYYVTQIRKEQVEDAELIDLALELQKEGLWERLKMGDELFVRQFFEDGYPVFQLWRQIF